MHYDINAVADGSMAAVVWWRATDLAFGSKK